MTEVSVNIHFLNGTAATWTTGHPIIDDDGVGPLTGRMLGTITGLFTSTGAFVQRGDSIHDFDCTMPLEVLLTEVGAACAEIERMRGEEPPPAAA